MAHNIFFDSWRNLSRTGVVGVLAYSLLIVFLRVSGKRTLSKMNAFDFIVTISLGSVLASILLNKTVPLAQGALAMIVLIGLQFGITWSSLHVRSISKLMTGEPTLLLYRGAFQPAGLRACRVTENEIRAAVRAASLASLDQAEAVVLETDGSFSVIPRSKVDGEATVLSDVARAGDTSVVENPQATQS